MRDRRADLPAELDGLGGYDVRRPMTPTGTDLLGLVERAAFRERVEAAARQAAGATPPSGAAPGDG